MRIAIIAQCESNTIQHELIPALQARGHICDRLTFETLRLTSITDDPMFQRLSSYDVVYYRTGLGAVGVDFLRSYLTKHATVGINLSPRIHPFTNRKKYQCAVAAEHGVIVPVTMQTSTHDFVALAEGLGVPFVAKGDESSQGRDVHRIRDAVDLEALAPLRQCKDYLYQTYVPHEHDYRVHIVGGKAVAAYRRTAVQGDFRTNVHLGASMQAIEEVRRVELYERAEYVNELFGLDISAVDFLPHRETGELYFAEINDNPGWELSDTEATGVNMTECVVAYLESRVG